MFQDLHYAIATSRTWWYAASLRSRARFKRTLLGDAWLGASNLLSIGVLAYVYTALLHIDNARQYIVYVGVGLTVWQFIAMTVSSSGTLLPSKKQQLFNTAEQPIYYFLQEWAFQVQGFIQSWLFVLVALSFLAGPWLLIHGITIALLPIANLLVFCLSAQIIFALLGVRYQDFYQLLPLFLQLSFLSTPILFNKLHLGGKQWIASWNPLYRILEPVRRAAIHGDINLPVQLFCLGLNILILALLMRTLNKNRQRILFLL